jgi:hypothetical protein
MCFLVNDSEYHDSNKLNFTCKNVTLNDTTNLSKNISMSKAHLQSSEMQSILLATSFTLSPAKGNIMNTDYNNLIISQKNNKTN